MERARSVISRLTGKICLRAVMQYRFDNPTAAGQRKPWWATGANINCMCLTATSQGCCMIELLQYCSTK